MRSIERRDSVNPSRTRDSDGSSPEGRAVKWTYWSKAAKAIMGIGVVTLLTAAFYRVRELLAALILFSFVFGVVILAMLILWLVGETTHKAAAVLESQMPHILPHAVAAAPARGSRSENHVQRGGCPS